MAGSGVTLYAVTAAGNKTVIGTIDWREDVYMPSQINDNLAQIMADIRAMANAVATGWIEIGDGDGTYTATYVSATSFRFDGVNVASYYRAGMRVRVVASTPGTIDGTITSSVFSTHTTLVVVWDSGSLSNEAITSVSLGIGSGGASGTAGARTDCRLEYSSAAAVVLTRSGGSQLTIDNTPQTIPAAGVTMSNGSLVASTGYFVYAYMNAGVMTLEISALGIASDPRNGLVVKSGDPTRTLVGYVKATAGATFADTATQRLVASYWNRLPKIMKAPSTAGFTTASTSFATVTGMTVDFLAWADMATTIGFGGSMTNTTATAVNYTGVHIDTVLSEAYAEMQVPGASYNVTPNVQRPLSLASGAHTATCMGRVSSGSGSWFDGTASLGGLAMSGVTWI